MTERATLQLREEVARAIAAHDYDAPASDELDDIFYSFADAAIAIVTERIAETAEALVRDMLVELRRLAEWNDDEFAGCPSCENRKFEGHRDDCSLAALIARARAELEGKKP